MTLHNKRVQKHPSITVTCTYMNHTHITHYKDFVAYKNCLSILQHTNQYTPLYYQCTFGAERSLTVPVLFSCFLRRA